MKTTNHLKLFVLIINLSVSLHAMDGPSLALQDEWDKEVASPKRPEKLFLADDHVVFVPGIFNELSNLFNQSFKDNIQIAKKEFGATTDVICLSSKDSIKKNAEELYDIVKNMFDQDKKPVLLVGHSKGGSVILDLVLRHPELLLENVISQVLLIQASIFGSPLVERIDSCGAKMFADMLEADLECLTPDGALRNLHSAFADYDIRLTELATTTNEPETQLNNDISSRIFYVCSYYDRPITSIGLKIILSVLDDSLDNDNVFHDGLVPLHNQMHGEIGTLLGTVFCDHSGLTVVEPISNVSSTKRKAFMRLIFNKMCTARERM